MMHPRPKDATGLFWACVSLVAGLFFAMVFPPLTCVLAAVPFCCFWQFRKWRADSSIVQAATNWCRQNYPTAGNAPVVDFIVALAHDAEATPDQLSTTTKLDSLNWMSCDDPATCGHSASQDRTQEWLEDLFDDAGIRGHNLSTFSGGTLNDAVKFLVADCSEG